MALPVESNQRSMLVQPLSARTIQPAPRTGPAASTIQQRPAKFTQPVPISSVLTSADKSPTEVTTHLSESDVLNEVNEHTKGQEFYGPSGILSFLSTLRAKARCAGVAPAASSIGSSKHAAGNGRRDPRFSMVSYMHDDSSPATAPTRKPLPVADVGVEKEWVRLFFQNLHYIHPVLGKLVS